MRRFSHLSHLRKSNPAHYALELRSRMTDAEMRIWYHLRDRRLRGFKFRRQVPIGDFVVDFVCEPARLIIEIDGGQHDMQRVRDEARTRTLTAHGYRVLRFWNNEVMANVSGVLERITEALTLPLPPPKGGGTP